ncbi:MAG: hypothetical protein LBQ36_03985 [Synergistaceae bacterium]|jgi:hypothetical protein|nr:hypothetical protein [Synergistaceae bacterium]
MKFRGLVFLACAAFLVSSLGASGAGAGEALQGDGFDHTFGPSSFKMNRDAVKEETVENGLFKVVPRLTGSTVFSRFALPEYGQGRFEWTATASVSGSRGSAAGVGLWNADDGYVFCVYPDGSSFLRRYERNSVSWSQAAKISGFSFPANLTIWIDANGSVLAMTNGVVVAAKLADIDLKKKASERMTSASFVTASPPGNAAMSAHYRSLRVRATAK